MPSVKIGTVCSQNRKIEIVQRSIEADFQLFTYRGGGGGKLRSVCFSGINLLHMPIEMTKTFRGHVARASTEVLQLLNIGIAVTSVYMEQPPSIIGWWFVAVGIVSFLAVVFGVRAAIHTKWFSWYMISLAISVSTLLYAALVIFTKVNDLVRKMNSQINYKDTKNLVKLNGAIFFIMGSVQVVILALAIIASCCEFVDYYEDLETADLWGIADDSILEACG